MTQNIVTNNLGNYSFKRPPRGSSYVYIHVPKQLKILTFGKTGGFLVGFPGHKGSCIKTLMTRSDRRKGLRVPSPNNRHDKSLSPLRSPCVPPKLLTVLSGRFVDRTPRSERKVVPETD